MSPRPARAYPHEKRVLRNAGLALAAATGLALLHATLHRGAVLGVEVPLVASLGTLALGALAGAAALWRREAWIALVAVLLLALGGLAGAGVSPGPAGYALGLAFAVAAYAFGEMVHMTNRYEKAHEAVDTEGVPEEHLNQITDEALRTLLRRLALTTAVAGGAVGLALLLALVGPAKWRAAYETASPLGVAVITLLLLGAVGLTTLWRGASLRAIRTRFRRRAPPPPTTLQEPDLR